MYMKLVQMIVHVYVLAAMHCYAHKDIIKINIDFIAVHICMLCTHILYMYMFREELPNSFWQCYHVHWDDKVEDHLSPWDMHSVDSDLSSYIEQVMTTPITVLEQEWGSEREQERILKGLEIVLGLDEAHMFREPVSLESVPNYCTVVAFPTDLGTITEKLFHRFYRCVRA